MPPMEGFNVIPPNVTLLLDSQELVYSDIFISIHENTFKEVVPALNMHVRVEYPLAVIH